jgi:hypothetical protein
MRKEEEMQTWQAPFVILAAALTLSTAAAAGESEPKQRIAINASVIGEAFALVPLQPGTVKRDSGRMSGDWRSAPGRDIVRNGQTVGIYTNTWTLGGKRGTLTIRERTQWVSAGADGNGDGEEDYVAIGTWKVVRGTGAYAGLTGGGGSGHAGLGRPWNARFEGS